jgi:hypothetical protein
LEKQDCFKLVGVLFTTYPSANLDTKHVEAYVSALVDLPRDSAAKAVDALRKAKVFLPSVAEIREAVAAIEQSKAAAAARLKSAEWTKLSRGQLVEYDRRQAKALARRKP